MAIGIPSSIIWIFGVPIIGLIFLWRNRRDLTSPIFFGRYRMVYQGLKPQYFYWEFVNITRKGFLVLVNVFLNLYPSIFKALLSLFVLVLFMRVQESIKPY